MQSAAKVGLLLVVFIALLVGGYAVLGKSLFAPPVVRYMADFPDAGGITPGTPVNMAGVPIGTVAEVKLLSPKQARMSLDIKEGVQIPAGSVALIPSSLIGLGQNPLEIVPPERLTGAVASKEVPLVGKKGSPLDSFLPNSGETVGELTKTMAAVRKLLEDEQLKGRFETLMATSNQTIDKFGKLAGEVQGLLNENHANLNRAIATATNAMQDVRQVTYQVAKLMNEGKLQKNAEQILQRIQTIEKHADDLVVSLNNLVNDPNLRGPANRIAENAAQISETGKTIADNTAKITANGTEISAQGVEISKNVNTITTKAIELTDKANEIAANAVDIENQLKGVLDKVGGFFNRSPGAGKVKLGSQIDLMRQTSPGLWRTDITFDTPLPDGKLYIGLFDAFEKNKLTVELGKPVSSSLQYRYGIYASKPGVGVDYSLSSRLSLRADAWDINRPRLDLRARYDFGNGLVGWFGFDRVFHQTAPTIGIGVRR